MRKITMSAAAILLSLAGASASADTLPRPTASYDGTATVTSGGNQFTATVNAAGPRQRWTADVHGTPQTVLVNRDTGAVTLLVPAFGAAMAIDTQGAAGFNLAQLNTLPVTAEAHETIDGIDTIRYAVTAESRQGSFTGHVWVSEGGILMRIEGTGTQNGKATPISAAMTEVHLRAQNPALLNLPPKTRVIPLAIVGAGKGATVP